MGWPDRFSRFCFCVRKSDHERQGHTIGNSNEHQKKKNGATEGKRTNRKRASTWLHKPFASQSIVTMYARTTRNPSLTCDGFGTQMPSPQQLPSPWTDCLTDWKVVAMPRMFSSVTFGLLFLLRQGLSLTPSLVECGVPCCSTHWDTSSKEVGEFDYNKSRLLRMKCNRLNLRWSGHWENASPILFYPRL